MLSFPHMIVVFIVVLVVFGPQKLPELARGLGKLMAEFRKASTDFRSAFEQEMRDLERQTLLAERQKAADAAATASAQPHAAGPVAGSESAPPLSSAQADINATEAPVVSPAPGSMPRSAAASEEVILEEPADGAPAAPVAKAAVPTASAASEDPTHDQQQPI
jgi:sec-independent protein translocase protein TatB